MEKKRNSIDFEVCGAYALFSDPITRVGGEKSSLQIPTYEAIKGIVASVYWKPTFIWYIDAIRVINPIRMEVKGVRPKKYDGGNALSYYTYLKDVRYQVRAHFEWNMNRPELKNDRNENKHHNVAKRMVTKGGRRDIFLGTRECQAYVGPCDFGSGAGAFDEVDYIAFGLSYHGLTYPDEAYSSQTKNMITARYWYPEMRNGIVKFLAPYDCPLHRPVRKMYAKVFDADKGNFTVELPSGLEMTPGDDI